MRCSKRTSGTIRTILLTGVCLVTLGGCSWLEDWPPGNKNTTVHRAAPPPAAQQQQTKIMKTADSTWMAPSSPANAVPIEPIQAKGLNVNSGDTMQRLEELELAVAEIRNDMSMMMPALTKIAEAQSDIQSIIARIEPAAGGSMGDLIPPPQQNNSSYQQHMPSYNDAYSNNVSSGTPVALNQPQGALPSISVPSRAAQPPVAVNNNQGNSMSAQYARQQTQQQIPPQYAQQPPMQQNYGAQQASYGGGASSVYDVRFGEHPGKTRMVLDVSNKVAFRYDIDNNERILMIEMPGTSWNSMTQNMVNNSPLVSSYTAMPDGQGGTQLAIQLKQPASVQWADSLDAVAGKNARIVFDIAPL